MVCIVCNFMIEHVATDFYRKMLTASFALGYKDIKDIMEEDDNDKENGDD